MSRIKTVKDILSSNDFLESRQKSQKYVRHEFQDYAYRLAADMGDLQHRAIYMKLAKTVDRVTLEQAAAFAKDYTKEPNKGKIFMWRLAELRAAAKFKKDLQNTDYQFVMQRMSEFYSELARVLVKKQGNELSSQMSSLQRLVELLQPDAQVKRKQKVLVMGSGGGSESGWLAGCHLAVTGLEISPALVKLAKREAPEAKFIGKRDFLQNSFTDKSFSAAWCGRMWQILPLEVESDYLSELARVLIPQGYLYLEIRLTDKEYNRWEEFTLRDKQKMRFVKCNELDKLERKYRKAGFKYVDTQQLPDNKVGLFLQLQV